MTVSPRLPTLRLRLSASLAALAVGLLLGGCASSPGTGPSDPGAAGVPATGASMPALAYRCDDGSSFSLRRDAGADAVVLEGSGLARETLMRDAGGASPEEAVFSSTRTKLELGLAPGGRGAMLRQAEPARALRCERRG